MALYSKITIDFETESSADLRKLGVWNYSKHPTTDIICMAYLLPNSEKPLVWLPNQPFPTEIFNDHLKTAGKLSAFNSFFELCIWNNVLTRYTDLVLGIEDLVCVQSKSLACALPISLSGVSTALNLDVKKTDSSILKKYAKDRSLLQLVCDYCIQDVIVTSEIDKILPDLNNTEQAVYWLTQDMNYQGIKIDVDFCKVATQMSLKVRELAAKQFLDNYGIDSPNKTKVILEYLNKLGYNLPNLNAAIVSDYLKTSDTFLKDFFKLRGLASKRSLDKYPKMLELAAADGYVRGAWTYHGAVTGRWTSQSVQFQNFPRPSVKIDDNVRNNLTDYTDPHEINSLLSSALRSTLISPENLFIVNGDYSSIEFRVILWLVGMTEHIDKINNGVDLYVDMAAKIFDKPYKEITKDERFVGKVACLSLIYQVGRERLFNTLFAQNNKTTMNFVNQVISVFRAEYSKVVELWNTLEKAAIRAVDIGKVTNVANLVVYKKDDFLYIELPSLRKLSYHKPEYKLIEVNGTVKRSLICQRYEKAKNTTKNLYGGMLVENVCQAIARDIVAYNMLNINKQPDMRVVAMVHDDVLAYCTADKTEEFHKLLNGRPNWAIDCPISVPEINAGVRYG